MSSVEIKLDSNHVQKQNLNENIISSNNSSGSDLQKLTPPTSLVSSLSSSSSSSSESSNNQPLKRAADELDSDLDPYEDDSTPQKRHKIDSITKILPKKSSDMDIVLEDANNEKNNDKDNSNDNKNNDNDNNINDNNDNDNDNENTNDKKINDEIDDDDDDSSLDSVKTSDFSNINGFDSKDIKKLNNDNDKYSSSESTKNKKDNENENNLKNIPPSEDDKKSSRDSSQELNDNDNIKTNKINETNIDSTKVKSESTPIPQTNQSLETPNGITKNDQTQSSNNIKTEEKPKIENDSLPKHQQKFANSMLRSLKKLKDAYPFLSPVDPVKLNIPDYLTVIKSPMDLSTMEKKLHSNQYSNIDSFVKDFTLIVSNCEQYNGVDAKISQMARNLRNSFDRQFKQMPPVDFKPDSTKRPRRSTGLADSLISTPSNNSPAPSTPNAANSSSKGTPVVTSRERPKRDIHPPAPKDLLYTEAKPKRRNLSPELRFCGQLIKELMSKKHETYSFPFLQPVDPVALDCPTYFQIVKKPMDLSTIQSIYDADEYETAEEFEADVRLMFKNCYKFNPEGSPVNLMGHRLEAVFNKKWEERPKPLPKDQSPPSEKHNHHYNTHTRSSSNGGSHKAKSVQQYDSESEESGDDNDPAIKYLEQALERMKSELNNMKKSKFKKKAAKDTKEKEVKETNSRRQSVVDNKSRRKSNAKAKAPPLHVSYELKKDLSDRISKLTSQDKILKALQIIHESMPELGNAEEVELDVDQLNPATTIKLYQYVVKNTPGPPAVKFDSNGYPVPANSRATASKAKKSRPLTEAEQKRQIDSIEKKIRQLEGKEEEVEAPPPPQVKQADESSSSDDSEEESSEEE